MASMTLTLDVDTALVQRQIGQLTKLLEHLPKRRAKRFSRKAMCLLHCARLGQVVHRKGGVATRTSCLAFQLRILGMDELIAAAMRARSLK